MQDNDTGPNRRAFLATVAGASTALAAAAVAETATLPRAEAAPLLAHGEWDLSWVDRVMNARHKAVFDSTEVAGGAALVNAFFCLRDFASVYKATDADMGVVVVIRHAALPIVFGDESWAEFKLGAMTKIKDPATGEDAVRNPFAHVKPGDKTVLYDPATAVDTLMARGVVFLCCNEALGRYAEMVGKDASLPTADARAALIKALIPGTLLVPSGIFGLTRAGEAGCHYLRSS